MGEQQGRKPATPLPWSVGPTTTGRYPAYPLRAAIGQIAEMQIMAHGRTGADAAYIVAACNAHPKLLEALRGVMALVKLADQYGNVLTLDRRYIEAAEVLRECGEAA